MNRELKTRCYYTEYVNHMIRFYIKYPDSIMTEGKRRADIENWLAVQDVFHNLKAEDRERVTAIFKTHYNLPKAVDMYCEKTGTEKQTAWVLLTKVTALIARSRGLV